MGSLGAMLRHPDDVYPLLKLKMAMKHAEKQIPPEPHWAFCYTMLHKVSRSFGLVIQQLDTNLRNAVSIVGVLQAPMMNELDKACGLMSADDAGMADGMPEYAEEWRSFEMKADHLCAQPEAGTSRTPSPQSVQTGDFQAEFWDAQDAGQDASAQQPNCGLEGDEARLCMNSAKSCHACGTTNTPQWRGGPNGPQTLCNACGLQFNRNQARAARQASASSARPAPARAPDSPSGGNGSGGSGMSGRSGPKHAGSKASSRQQDAPTGCEAAAPAAADATAPRARPMRKAAMVAASRTVLFARAVEMDLDTEMDEAGYAYAYGTNELDAAEHHTEEGCGHHGTAGAGGDGEHGSSEENGDEGGMGAGRQDAHPGGLMRGELMGSVACSMVDLGELAAHDGMSMLPPPPASSADASAAASRKRRASTGTAVGLRSSGAEVVASNMPAAAKRRASHGVDAEAVGAASDAGATAAAMGPMPRIRIRAPPPLLMPKAVAGGAAAAQQHVLTPALEQSAAGTKHTAPAPANSDKKRRSNGMAVPAPLLAPAPRPPRVPRVLSPSAPALLMPASAASHTVAVSAVSARAPAAAVAAPVPAASQPHAAVTGTGVSLSSSAPTPVVQIGVCAAAPIAIPAVGAEQSASPASASAPAVAAIAFAAAAAQQQRAKGRRPAAAAAASASAIQDSKATPPADGDVHAQAAAAAHMMGGHEQMDVLSPFGEDTTLLGPGAGASNGEDGFYHFDQFKFETEAEQFKFEVEEGGVGVELEQPQFLPSSHKVEEEEGQLLQFESHHTQYGGEMMNMVYGGIHGGIPAADDAYGLPHMLPASLHVMASCSVPDQMLPCSAYEGSCGELGGHEGGRHTGMHPSHHPNSRTPSPGMAQMCGSQPNLNLGLPPLSGTHLPVGQPLSHLSGACPRNGTHGLPAIRRHSLGAPPPSATATGPFCMGGAPTGPVLPAMGTIMEDGASRETTLGQPAPARACAGAPAPLAPSPEPCIYTVAGGDGSGGIVRGSCGSEGGVSSGASGVSSAACLSECCGVMKRMEWMLGECGASHTLPNEAVGELRAVGGDVQRAADEASAAGAALAAVQRVLEARHAEAERAHQAALAAARRMSDLMATLATKFDLPGPPVDMVSTGEVCMGTAYLRFPLPNTSAGCQPPRTNTPVPLTPAPRPLHAAPFTGSAAASAGCDGGVLEVADLGVTATDCMVTAGLCDLTPLGEPMEMDLGSSLVGDLDIGLSLMI